MGTGALQVIPIRIDINPVPSSPIDLQLVRDHLRVDGTEEDHLIESYANAALIAAEHITRRTIVAREHRWTLSDFPRDQDIRLPRGKTQSVKHIKYRRDGLQTLTGPTSAAPGTDYQENLSGDDGGLLLPVKGESWPDVDADVVDPVVITFNAGWDTLPEPIVQAVLLIVGHWEQNRQSVVVGATTAEVPMSAQALLSSYMLTRWY